MGEVSQKFDSAKNELQRMSHQVPTAVKFNKVDTSGGLFNLGDHYVNGYEFNSHIAKLQDNFNEINKNILQAYKLSGVMFQLSDALETDYLAKFKVSLDEAVVSGKKAEKAANEAKAAQATADGNIKALQSSLEALKRTNVRLEEFRRKAEMDIQNLESRLARTQGGAAPVSSPRSIGPIIAIAIIGTISLVHLILDVCGVL